MELQEETTQVLQQLVRFDTVNPPGDEARAQEWLAKYLEDAGLEVELHGYSEERPNLVARLRGAGDGPTLGYLSHMDTVLADAQDWQRDPWSGDVVDGELWGRGALDMKSQTAAEAVAVASLARAGWRPPHGDLLLICVVDEEVGGTLGAEWMCEHHPDLVRCDYLINEGAGAHIPYGERRLYGVCCAEKGTFRFTLTTHGVAGHASLPRLGDNALLKLAPLITRLSSAPPEHDMTPFAGAFLEALGEDAGDPRGAIERITKTDRRLAGFVEPMLSITFAPTQVHASDKINVLPARAELRVDCRVPPGLGEAETLARLRHVLGDDEGVKLGWIEQKVGNGSPAQSPLMDAIAGWVGEADPGADIVPTMLPAFTDSRTFRAAFPDCVAYGFFPQRHMSLYDQWPLIHGKDERIDVRDLGFAAACYADLPKRLLA
jgi:acetylornithine deacetylase/succinyl-diaminopimelate desuccinylase-like protein